MTPWRCGGCSACGRPPSSPPGSKQRGLAPGPTTSGGQTPRRGRLLRQLESRPGDGGKRTRMRPDSRSEQSDTIRDDVRRLHALGLCPGAGPAAQRVLELRDLALDHLHPGRRRDLVSPRALQRGRGVDRAGLAAGFAVRAGGRGHDGPARLDVSRPRAACITGRRSWADGAGAGPRPGSTSPGWSPCWPRSTSGTYRFALGALGPPPGMPLGLGCDYLLQAIGVVRSRRPRRRSITWASA